MSKRDGKTESSAIEESLRRKGAITASGVIRHEDLIADKKLFNELTHLEHEYLQYLRYKEAIKKVYQETKDWDKVITSGAFFSDTTEGNDSFIDYVEELYQVKVKDAKHLQKLTGVKENGLEELGDILLKANYTKFYRALEIAVEEGAKYKDLLEIKPQAYGLPETWDLTLTRDQYTAILWVISLAFLMNEPGGLMMAPSLRAVAREMEAPYSVIMDAYKLHSRYK